MWIIIILLVIVVVFILITYNSLIKLDNRVKEAFSTMDVYLKKRWDLIPNIIDVVKGYAKYEKDTLESVISIRNSSYDNMSMEDKLSINDKLSSDISKLMILVEDYPELKVSDSFMNLSKELVKVEEDIANARKYYNGTVRLYNNKVEMFPSNLVAKVLGYKLKNMFEVSSSERENVDVNL